MRRALMVAAGFVACFASAPALAADMPIKARPAPPPAVADWGGFYFGGHVGWGWARGTDSITDPSIAGGSGGIGFPPGFGVMSPTNDNHDGVRAGVLLGYNWQVMPSWVLGLEGDWSAGALHSGGFLSGLSNVAFTVPTSFATVHTSLNNIGTIRARVGYTTPDWMLYATGGAAFADIDYSGDFGCALGGLCTVPLHAPVAFSKTKTGFVVGAGAEHKLMGSHWIAGIEYLFYHFGGESTTAATSIIPTGTPAGFGPCTGGVACIGYSFGAEDVHTVRARLSYKFN